MNVRPLTIEMILRSNRRDRPLLVGWLIESLLEAAHKLAPEFAPAEPRKALGLAKLVVEQDEPSAPPPSRVPRWVRRLVDPDETSQALVEYALILALIAVIVIIALTFLGQQLASTLSAVGSSISDTAP